MKRVAAADPGLASFGLVTVDTDGRDHRAVDADVFTSKPKPHLNDNASDDRAERAKDLYGWLVTKLNLYKPVVLVTEAMGFAKNNHAVISMAMGYTVLTLAALRCGVPVRCARTMVWRTAICGADTSEDAAHRSALRTVPTARDLIKSLGRDAIQAHARDALGVFCWGIQQREVMAMVMR